jgi:O-antigen ligase
LLLAFCALFLSYERTALVFFVTLPMGLAALWALSKAVAKVKTVVAQLRWWHILWLLMLLSGLVFRVRDTEAASENPLDLWGLYRVALMGIIGFVLLYRLARHRPDWARSLARGLIGLIAGYALLSIASAAWSVYPTWTLYKSTEFLIDVALITAIVASIRAPEEFATFFDWTWLLIALLVGTAWLGAVIWPNRAFIHGVGLLGIQLRGVLPAIDSNGLAELSAVLGIVFLTRFLFASGQKSFYILGFLAAVSTLILAQGRSALAGFVVASCLALFATRRIGLIALCSPLILSLLALTPAAEVFWEFLLRGQQAEYFDSLSGRTDIWRLGWTLAQEQPLTGYGAYAGPRFAGAISPMGARASSMLSTWFEILLGLGFPGAVLVLGALLAVWVTLLRFVYKVKGKNVLMRRLALEALGVLTVISVRSIFTPNLIWHPPVSFLLVLGFAEFIRRTYRSRADKTTHKEQLYGLGRLQKRGWQVTDAGFSSSEAPSRIL